MTSLSLAELPALRAMTASVAIAAFLVAAIECRHVRHPLVEGGHDTGQATCAICTQSQAEVLEVQKDAISLQMSSYASVDP